VAAVAQPRPRATPVRSALALSGLRVILVEDDPHTREGMRWTLAQSGAYVTAVGTGTEALAALGSSRAPLVIVSDLGLPGLSGFELVERVVQHFARRGLRPPPSLAVSAHARDVDRKRAIDSGFDMYLAKPISPERLVEAVGDLRHVLPSQHA
jgi:CheY-like chemotaxis protein